MGKYIEFSCPLEFSKLYLTIRDKFITLSDVVLNVKYLRQLYYKWERVKVHKGK